MEDHETTHRDAIERQIRRSCPGGSRTATRGATEARRHRTRPLSEEYSAEGCKSLCGESIRLPGLVGSGGARPACAPARAFRRPCLAAPKRAL